MTGRRCVIDDSVPKSKLSASFSVFSVLQKNEWLYAENRKPIRKFRDDPQKKLLFMTSSLTSLQRAQRSLYTQMSNLLSEEVQCSASDASEHSRSYYIKLFRPTGLVVNLAVVKRKFLIGMLLICQLCKITSSPCIAIFQTLSDQLVLSNCHKRSSVFCKKYFDNGFWNFCQHIPIYPHVSLLNTAKTEHYIGKMIYHMPLLRPYQGRMIVTNLLFAPWFELPDHFSKFKTLRIFTETFVASSEYRVN